VVLGEWIVGRFGKISLPARFLKGERGDENVKTVGVACFLPLRRGGPISHGRPKRM
jgi:hypothetical protein